MVSSSASTNAVEASMEVDEEEKPNHQSETKGQRKATSTTSIASSIGTAVRINDVPGRTSEASYIVASQQTAKSSLPWAPAMLVPSKGPSCHSNANAGQSQISGMFKKSVRNISVFQRFKSERNEATKSKPLPRVFVDPDAMKEKLRGNMAKPDYNVCDFYKTSGCSQMVARHWLFERLTISVISINAIWIWIDTDYSQSGTLSEAPWPFQVAEHSFCAYFFMEWCFRFCAFRRKRDGCRDGWFVFDSMLVGSMVLETWIMSIIVLLMGGGGLSFNPAVMRLLRLLRLSRMMRMARLLRHMPELLIMIKGMMAAARSVFFTLLLLVIILYVFGIAFTQLLMETDAGRRYFDTVPQSMHTLLLYGTLLDNVSLIVKILGKEHFIYALGFYIFILLSALTVLNMLIGVLCEVVSAVASTERESASVAHVKWLLTDLMKDGGIDDDGDGFISKAEFCALLDNPMAARVLHEAGIDVFGLVDCADFIFQSLSKEDMENSGADSEEPQLTFAKFLEVVLSLRGSNVASVKDIIDLRRSVHKQTKDIQESVARLTRMISRDVHNSIFKDTRRDQYSTASLHSAMAPHQMPTPSYQRALSDERFDVQCHARFSYEVGEDSYAIAADRSSYRSNVSNQSHVLHKKGSMDSVGLASEKRSVKFEAGTIGSELEEVDTVGVWHPIDRANLQQAQISPTSENVLRVAKAQTAVASSQSNGPRVSDKKSQHQTEFFSIAPSASPLDCRAPHSRSPLGVPNGNTQPADGSCALLSEAETAPCQDDEHRPMTILKL